MATKVTKPDVIKQLTAAKIKFSARAKLEDLVKLLPTGPVPSAPGAVLPHADQTIPQDPRTPKAGSIVDASVHTDIEVGDPEILRPRTLPLVVKPAGKTDDELRDLPFGGWEHEAASQYAQTLNAYAYKNPGKWAVKKNVLIGRLQEIRKDASKLAFYRGGPEAGNGTVKYTDKRLEVGQQ